jgi:hypothetical protein
VTSRALNQLSEYGSEEVRYPPVLLRERVSGTMFKALASGVRRRSFHLMYPVRYMAYRRPLLVYAD